MGYTKFTWRIIMKTTIIIGGVAGGMSAATRLRRLNESMNIIVLEKGPYVSFANCGLPYHISGEISERDALILQTPQSLANRFKLDVRVNTEAIDINGETKEVTILHGGSESTLKYDDLILSPGAKPFVPPIKGLSDVDHVFTLRNVPDTDAIMAYIEEHKPTQAAVIGAGFIGIEMAESLKAIGLDVTIIEKAPHILPPLDVEMAAFIDSVLVKEDITVLTENSAVEINKNSLILEDGTVIDAQLIIMSVGVQPESTLAKKAGIKLGMRGGILVNELYETSIPQIYAVGDATITKNTITQEDALIALASPANRQGRQVADVISGQKRSNKGSLGAAIVRVFDSAIGSVGLNERAVKERGYPYAAVHIRANNHAGYFPNATPLVLKMVFNKEDGTIYGAQVFGQEGVDKRLDILSTAIKANLDVFDLTELEFTYAPPFGSAKDPVNMLGYVASNIVEGTSNNIQWHELADIDYETTQLVDVSLPNEFQGGHIKGFINIPLDDLRSRLDELDPKRNIIVSCRSGQRSYMAERILKQSGFNVTNLDGAFGIYSMGNPGGINRG